MALLDAIFAQQELGGAAQPGAAAASTKAVQNLIERHVGPGDALLLFTAADLKLEARVVRRTGARTRRTGALSWPGRLSPPPTLTTAPLCAAAPNRAAGQAAAGALDRARAHQRRDDAARRA